MKILSYNINGIRAGIKKGLLDFLKEQNADIVCFQETKASYGDVNPDLFTEIGYPNQNWFSANKKGYSGVAVYSKEKPQQVILGNGFEQSDFEGRVIQLRFKKFTLLNIYFPSGTSGDIRQDYKYQFLKEMYEYLENFKKTETNIIVLGDFNIAHKEIDIHDPKGNKNNSGFLPAEREWMDKLLASGWIDTLRKFNPEPDIYTWWSQRFPSVRLNNKGWRIDYIITTTAMENNLKASGTLPEGKHSDHCSLWLELK